MMINNILKLTFNAVVLILIIAIALFILINFLNYNLQPNLILITAQSLRPDHLGCYGYEHIATPNIDSLAKKGIIFENVYCGIPLSLEGYVSVLTGKEPGALVSQKGDVLLFDTKSKLLSEYLKQKGYSAVAITSDRALFAGMGLDKGFDSFKNVLLGMRPEEFPIRAGEVTNNALEVLKGYKNKKKPVFLWLDYSIPQFPYLLPDDFTDDKNDFPYDRQILLLDSEIGNLLKGLAQLGLLKKSVIVFTSTNGESINEHNEPIHGVFVYNATTKIPLIIRLPKGASNKQVAALSSQTNIAPTVLDILNIGYKESDFDGKSAMPYLKGEKDGDKRFVYLESLQGYDKFGWSPVVGVVYDNYKYIELPKPELYDLVKDPHELKNIIYQENKKAELLKEMLFNHMAAKRPDLLNIINKGADPKEKIVWAKPQLLDIVLQSDNEEQLIVFYRQSLVKDPENKAFKLTLAKLYMNTKKEEMAKGILEELTQKYPDLNDAWELLGMIYQHQKENDKAISCYEKAIALFYDMPNSLNNLAWLYAVKGKRLDEALKYSQRANELVKDQPVFIDTLSEVYLKAGDKKKAIELLKTAVKLEPQSEYYRQRLKDAERKR